LIESTWSDVESAVRAIDPADIAAARWYLPEWMWAPLEGMRGLIAEAQTQ
jgi:hypothetical protein